MFFCDGDGLASIAGCMKMQNVFVKTVGGLPKQETTSNETQLFVVGQQDHIANEKSSFRNRLFLLFEVLFRRPYNGIIKKNELILLKVQPNF